MEARVRDGKVIRRESKESLFTERELAIVLFDECIVELRAFVRWTNGGGATML